jgi:hypothetical protein
MVSSLPFSVQKRQERHWIWIIYTYHHILLWRRGVLYLLIGVWKGRSDMQVMVSRKNKQTDWAWFSSLWLFLHPGVAISSTSSVSTNGLAWIVSVLYASKTSAEKTTVAMTIIPQATPPTNQLIREPNHGVNPFILLPCLFCICSLYFVSGLSLPIPSFTISFFLHCIILPYLYYFPIILSPLKCQTVA